MDGHVIRLGQQFIHRGKGAGIAQCQFLDHIEIAHLHAHRFGEDGKLCPNVAVADDTDGLAAHFGRAIDALFPTAVVG